MKTFIKTTGNTITIELLGKIAFESYFTIIDHFDSFLNPENEIVVDFQNLEFVGSTGITNFLQTLKKLCSSRSKKPILINVHTEFQKMILAMDKECFFDVRPAHTKKKLTSH